MAVFVVSTSPVVGRPNNLVSMTRRCGGLRTPRSADLQYAVVIDAGSSGSRVRVYSWPDNGGGEALMSGVKLMKGTLKIKVGLSRVADNHTKVRDHIERLINNASGYIPPSRHQVTPIYFMATAGSCQNFWYFQTMIRRLVLYRTVPFYSPLSWYPNELYLMGPKNIKIIKAKPKTCSLFVSLDVIPSERNQKRTFSQN